VAGYNGTTPAANAVDRRVVFYGNAQASSHCVFENLKVKNYGAAANTLHGVFYVTGVLGAITNSVIRDVYATELANFGLVIRDCQDTRIENVRLFGSTAYACAAFEDDGIYLPKVGTSEHVRVRDCHVQGFGGVGIYVGGSYVVVEANCVEQCTEWGIYVAAGAVRCVVSKNSVESCSTSPAHADGVAVYIVGDDARVSDNYAVVMNNTAGVGAYVAGLALNAARCLATGNNVNGIGIGGATLCGILFGNASVGSCVAVGNHMNGKGAVDLAGGNYCEVTHGNRGYPPSSQSSRMRLYPLPQVSIRPNSRRTRAMPKFRMRLTPRLKSSTVKPNGNVPGFSISMRFENTTTRIAMPASL